MSWIDALILGILQGLTEFLPVSSSGHLVLGQYFLGMREPHLFFDLMVHAGTLVATAAYYRHSLQDMTREVLVTARRPISLAERIQTNSATRLFALIVVGTIPTGVIGVAFKQPLEALFGAPRFAAGMLVATAVLLLTTLFRRGDRFGLAQMTWMHAILIGVAQGIAIVPGISRSGTTIAVALLLGMDRELAARFSFLLSLPAILGAVMLGLRDLDHVTATYQGGVLFVGFAASLVVGLSALSMLIPVVKRGQFYMFALYLVPVGCLGLIFLP